MSEAEKLRLSFDGCGIDPYTLMIKIFQGIQYEKSKNPNRYYSSNPSDIIQIIKFYYTLVYDSISFDNLKKAFVTRYVKNESELEEVNGISAHGKAEIEGLREMYEYIHSEDIEYMFDIYTLKDLHRKLFCKATFPEYAGDFRTWDVYLPGAAAELSEWSMIRPRLNALDKKVLELRERAKYLRGSCDTDALIEYLGDCVELNCQMIKVHPFGDGNGRTVRGFTNKLLEDAGLPPVYIKARERTAYHLAMNKANNEGDYTDIKNFYLYKICDSIIELDISDRAKKTNEARKSEETTEGIKVKKIGEKSSQ